MRPKWNTLGCSLYVADTVGFDIFIFNFYFWDPLFPALLETVLLEKNQKPRKIEFVLWVFLKLFNKL